MMEQTMEKIKSFFKNIYANIALIMGAVIGILLYYINLKNKENNSLKAKISLTKTQKEADLIEADINRLLNEKKLLKKETTDLEQALEQIKEQRKKISKVEAGKSLEEIEEFWKNN